MKKLAKNELSPARHRGKSKVMQVAASPHLSGLRLIVERKSDMSECRSPERRMLVHHPPPASLRVSNFEYCKIKAAAILHNVFYGTLG
ncbi:MAG: hypothetical protein ACE5IW_10215 [bacterium]